MRASSLVVGVTVLGLNLTACSPVAVGGPRPVVPGAEPSARIPRATHTGVGESSTMRYVCRDKRTTGWIAIDYIEDKESCPTSRAPNNVAVIVQLAVTPVGGTLEVCADELIPRNWTEVQMITGDSRCPPKKPASAVGKLTVREIRRVR